MSDHNTNGTNGAANGFDERLFRLEGEQRSLRKDLTAIVAMYRETADRIVELSSEFAMVCSKIDLACGEIGVIKDTLVIRAKKWRRKKQ